jgi:DNA recombination protein RmuC
MNITSILAIALAAIVGLLAGWWQGRGSTRAALQPMSELLRESKEEAERLRRERDPLLAERVAFETQVEELRRQNREYKDEVEPLRSKYTELSMEITRAEEQLKAGQQSLADERASFTRVKEEMENTFTALAAKSLKSTNEQFLVLAAEKFDAKQRAIDTLLQPMQQTLQSLSAQAQQLEVKREGAYKELGQQLLQLGNDQRNLQQAATALSSALRDTRTTGKWGEILLQRVVELAGMTEHCDYVQQHTQDDNRPDLIVHLPNGRKIIVDAKTSVRSFLDAADLQDEALRQQKLKEHARNIRAHALGLAKRRYEKAFEDAIDMTICFIPGDVFYYAALQAEPTLFEEAASEKIIFATPTTLITVLKAAAFGWQQDSMRREAKEILRNAQLVYDRLTTSADYLIALGVSLNKSCQSYDKLVGSLEGSVFPAARRMKELGIGGGELPSVTPLDKTTRQLGPKDWQILSHADSLSLAAAEEPSEEK